MPGGKIDRLIVNSPYEEPNWHWLYVREKRDFELVKGRRPAGYLKATPGFRGFDDPGIFLEIALVNQIRPRVKVWREAGYPGVTGITRRLLEYWTEQENFDRRRFFFCQREAIETLIWLAEAPPAEKVGISIPGDGGQFVRQCCKMATGTGKTVVMAMAIAWHILNKVTYPNDPRFSKHVLVIAPGLTVKKRLAVLYPWEGENYYEAFDIVPPALMDKLRQGKVLVRNWHALAWEREEEIAKRPRVDKRGEKSDEAYVREVLGEMARARRILVINDEAHHAWRVNPEMARKAKRRSDLREGVKEATIWVGGLDRIHEAREILCCYDFSATPFASSGTSAEESLFAWIVSDFGLTDAIEAGLVKTPRVVVREDTGGKEPELTHLYRYVKDDLNRSARREERLPDQLLNAYFLLGSEWHATWESWREAGSPTPPVMITVANRTETAARIKYAFEQRHIPIDELCDPEFILHIDSKVLEEAELREEPPAGDSSRSENGEETREEGELSAARAPTRAARAEELRRKVDTVGKPGQPGEKIRNVISVGMLSEGWDAKTVTHIMGLRAFTSQLLCEQVVGRGLRRTSYELNEEGLLDPEYVNVFGVPFVFLPHEIRHVPPPPLKAKTRIEPDPKKASFEIRWPNVLRIEEEFNPSLKLDLNSVEPLVLDAAETKEVVEIAPIVDGRPVLSKIEQIDLENVARRFRTQRIVFETVRFIFDSIQPSWRGSREALLAQLVLIVERIMASDRIKVTPEHFDRDDMRRRLVITLNMSAVVRHIWDAVRQVNSERLVPVFDREHPIGSTGDMRPWYTSKPCHPTKKSHINFCVFDSDWESSDAFVLDRSDVVSAWAKNDHLGFEIFYSYKGVVRKYRPDFLVRLRNGDMLVVETKGQEGEQDRVKRRYLDEWVRAINEYGGFGRWRHAVTRQPRELEGLLAEIEKEISSGLTRTVDGDAARF